LLALSVCFDDDDDDDDDDNDLTNLMTPLYRVRMFGNEYLLSEQSIEDASSWEKESDKYILCSICI
jgi:hypothetical protein